MKFDHVISGGDRTETECAACNFVFPTKKDYTLHLGINILTLRLMMTAMMKNLLMIAISVVTFCIPMML